MLSRSRGPVPFLGKRDREFPVPDKGGKFPGGREQDGIWDRPGNLVPVSDFNIVSFFKKKVAGALLIHIRMRSIRT